jgi:hypothetical protein
MERRLLVIRCLTNAIIKFALLFVVGPIVSIISLKKLQNVIKSSEY